MFFHLFICTFAIFFISCSAPLKIDLGEINNLKPYNKYEVTKHARPGELISSICYKEIFFIKDKNNVDLTLGNLLKQAKIDTKKEDFKTISLWMHKIDLGHAYKKICLELREKNAALNQDF